MPATKNTPQKYDANVKGPAPQRAGTLKVGTLSPRSSKPQSRWRFDRVLLGFACIALVGLGWRSFRTACAVALLLGLTWIPANTIRAEAAPAVGLSAEVAALIDQFKSGKTAKDAIAKIVEKIKNGTADRDQTVKALVTTAKGAESLTRRGWSISCLAEIGGQDVDEELLKIHANDGHSMLVRTWAAAARVSTTKSAAALVEKAQLIPTFPALGRPIGMRLVEKLGEDNDVPPEKLLQTTIQVPVLQQALAPAILAIGPAPLADVMTTSKDQNVRRQAAAYLGTLSQQGDSSVPGHVIHAYVFDPKTDEVPWNGGPLFLPGIAWPKAEAQQLVSQLIAWHLWCDRNGKKAEQKQIHNNLRSLSLARAAGYESPGFREVDAVTWLKTWGQAVGKDQVRAILAAQGVDKDEKYAGALK